MIDLILGLFIFIALGCGIRLLYESELMINELKKESEEDK
tara:strand:+ start:716 stop:835 length:120 start_codon:yes stop_codon:yes gene_type:complete